MWLRCISAALILLSCRTSLASCTYEINAAQDAFSFHQTGSNANSLCAAYGAAYVAYRQGLTSATVALQSSSFNGTSLCQFYWTWDYTPDPVNYPHQDHHDVTGESMSCSSSSSSASSSDSCHAGTRGEGIARGGARDVGSVLCRANGCAVQITSAAVQMQGMCPGGSCTVQAYEYTGGTCSYSDAVTASTETQEGNCAVGPNGTFCNQAPQGLNCGTVNGDQVCVGSVPSDKCVSFASGAVACGASAPVPNNGTAGVPATPTASVIDNSTGAVTNYYNSTVVNNSTSTVTTSGAGQNVGNSGAQTSAQASASSASSVMGCVENQDCNVNLPSTDRTDSVQSIVQTFVDGVQNSPMFQAVSSIAESFPTGSCPSAGFDLWGSHYDFYGSACTLWNDHVDPVLSTVMLAFYAVLGIRLVLLA